MLSVTSSVQTFSRANAAFWRAETGRDVAAIHPAWSSPSLPEACRGERSRSCRRPPATLEGPRHSLRGAQATGRQSAPVSIGLAVTPSGVRRDNYTSTHLARTFPDVWGKMLCHHPQISPVEVMRRQASALFNIVPSTWDVFNFTAVEAMASGRPAIVSTGAGASELIEDGVNGFLFANEDADALAETIERVTSATPTRLVEIGLEGRNTVRKALDPKTIAAQRVAAYQAAIGAFQAQRPAPVVGWLGAVCRPSEAAGTDMTFLENLPLRALAKHVAGRISRQVRPAMTNRPRLALLVPAYNAGGYLPRLLESAQRQAEPFDEIWVYDDCSTDETAAIAEHHGARSGARRYQSWMQHGKNVLVGRTSCEWVHFHDADDLLLPNFIACAHRWLGEEGVDVVVFGCDERWEEDRDLISVSSPDDALLAG